MVLGALAGGAEPAELLEVDPPVAGHLQELEKVYNFHRDSFNCIYSKKIIPQPPNAQPPQFTSTTRKTINTPRLATLTVKNCSIVDRFVKEMQVFSCL